MTKEQIIKENIRRLGDISAVYNPVTGEGSTSVERQWTAFEGFPIENINLPVSMLNDKTVTTLSQLGANGYIRQITGKEPSDRNIIQLWLQFCPLSRRLFSSTLSIYRKKSFSITLRFFP